jgi:hypothetical protein
MLDDALERSTRRGVAAVLAIAVVAVIALSTAPVLSAPGDAGPLKYIKGPNSTFGPGASTWTSGAICPQGWNVVGGGVDVDNANFRMAESYPTASNGLNPGRRGWTVNLTNGSGGTAHARAVAICAKATNLTGTWP